MSLNQYLRPVGSGVALLMLVCGAFAQASVQQRLEKSFAKIIEIASIPKQLGPWEGRDLPGLGLRSREILKLDRALRRLYRHHDGRQVILYIGYWAKQSGDYQAAKHSPSICLPANGWKIRKSEKQVSKGLTVNTVLAEFGHTESLFSYWFFTGEATFHEEWEALLQISLQALFHHRSDGGLVEISTDLHRSLEGEESEKQAKQTIEEFLSEIYPVLNKLTKDSSPLS